MVVYELQNCLYSYMFHWFVFILGGLRHLPKNEDGSPIKIYLDMPLQQQYHIDSLFYIKDKYEMVSKEEFLKAKTSGNVKWHEGEPLICADFVDPATYQFLADLYGEKIPLVGEKKKRKIYITRNDSSQSNPMTKGRSIRNVLNEPIFLPELKERGFEVVRLSDLTFVEKVQLFQHASVVISPHGSALLFSMFADKETKVIEILPEKIRDHDHYLLMCKHLNIPYYRYTGVFTEGEVHIHKTWNMRVKKEMFLSFVDKICI